jgi:hypothetical protein
MLFVRVRDADIRCCPPFDRARPPPPPPQPPPGASAEVPATAVSPPPPPPPAEEEVAVVFTSILSHRKPPPSSHVSKYDPSTPWRMCRSMVAASWAFKFRTIISRIACMSSAERFPMISPTKAFISASVKTFWIKGIAELSSFSRCALNVVSTSVTKASRWRSESSLSGVFDGMRPIKDRTPPISLKSLSSFA